MGTKETWPAPMIVRIPCIEVPMTKQMLDGIADGFDEFEEGETVCTISLPKHTLEIIRAKEADVLITSDRTS